MKGTMRWTVLVAMCVMCAVCSSSISAIGAHANTEELEGPYEDITELLASATSASSQLAALDAPPPPRVLEVHHNHHHVVPADMPAEVAETMAVASTPSPPRVRIVEMPNRARRARHMREDAEYHAAASVPSVTTVDSHATLTIGEPRSETFMIAGQGPDPAKVAAGKPDYQFPLVDRRLQRATFPVIAEMNGVDKASSSSGHDADWKPHTAKELQEEAKLLLKRAKALQAKKNAASAGHPNKELAESMGVFDSTDEGYEDEMTRLKRVSARMNRLREQIEVPHNQDTPEGSIARKRYFLKIYTQLKRDATEVIEGYALRTGHSIFEMFGDGKIDPSLAAFLPPNSVAAILSQYANPTTGRSDETPRDVISGRDAKRIRYAIEYFRAKRNGARVPLPPVYALTDEEEALQARHNNPLFNKVVATQSGSFGANRPAVTMGRQALGRSSVHIAVVNPTETQHMRGLPYAVNLLKKNKRDRRKLH